MSKKKIIYITGYFLFGILLFIIITAVRFPYESAKDYLIVRASNAIKKDIQIKDLSPTFPAGIRIKDLTVKKKESEGMGPVFSASQIDLKVNPASLFVQNKKVNLQVDAYGGQIRAKGTVSRQKVDLNLTYSGLDTKTLPLRELNIMNSSVSTNLSGTGNISFSTVNKEIKKGEVTIAVASGTIKDITLYGFSLPPVSYNSIILKGTINKNTLTITQAAIKAKEGEGDLTGKIILNKNLMESNITLALTFKISPSYMKKTGIPITLLGGKKDAKGFKKVTLSGKLRQPAIRF